MEESIQNGATTPDEKVPETPTPEITNKRFHWLERIRPELQRNSSSMDLIETTSPNETPDESPETPAPELGTHKKFHWLRDAKRTRNNPFVEARPDIPRNSSSSDLMDSPSGSRIDLFQNSRLNLFDTAGPKPEINSRYNSKGISLWGGRSVLEKCLFILSVLLTILVVILSVTISVIDSKPSEPNNVKQESELCLSPTCIYTASEVLRSLDTSRDPCNDFYEFACGGWIKNNPMPDGKSTWGIFSKLEIQNQLIIKNALEKLHKENASSAEMKAKLYYETCLDTNETIEELGGKPMLDVIRHLGGWHILPNTITDNKISFQNLFQLVQNRYNLGGLFNWAVSEDDRNSSRHVILLDQGGLNLPTRDNYLNKTGHKKVLDAYLQYMTDIITLLGANRTDARSQMKRVIDFETDLANITTPSEDRRDDELLYNPIKLAEWNTTINFIDWIKFFNNAFSLVNKTIAPNETIIVYAPEFFKKLTPLIKKYMKTEEGYRTVRSYLMWQVTRSLSFYLSKAFRDATKVLRKALYGSEGIEENWRYCVTDTNNAIGFAVGAMFVREVFHGEAKTQGEVMIDSIRSAFKENFKNLKWMDAETRRAAEIKADAIEDMIGFPNYILNPAQLDEQYEELIVKPHQYFQNNIEVNLYSLKQNMEKLDKPVNRTKWGMTPSTVNAYYTPTKNQIVFPAGILQLPFYDGENPRCINYGGMGVVMGHELTHAFDDQGREYDRFGNLNQWWNNATVKAFKERAKCFEHQYSSYQLDGETLNGKQTLGENIADNGGLKASFHAYLEHSRTASVNYSLPGLPYNHRQAFFISFAQVWCSAMTKEATKLQIEKDDHTISKYRVIGPLSNLKEFSDEFNCKPGSNMNPIHKCEVW